MAISRGTSKTKEVNARRQCDYESARWVYSGLANKYEDRFLTLFCVVSVRVLFLLGESGIDNVERNAIVEETAPKRDRVTSTARQSNTDVAAFGFPQSLFGAISGISHVRIAGRLLFNDPDDPPCYICGCSARSRPRRISRLPHRRRSAPVINRSSVVTRGWDSSIYLIRSVAIPIQRFGR